MKIFRTNPAELAHDPVADIQLEIITSEDNTAELAHHVAVDHSHFSHPSFTNTLHVTKQTSRICRHTKK